MSGGVTADGHGPDRGLGGAITRGEIPLPGQAVMPAPNAASLLRRNGTDPASAGRPAIRFGTRTWNHGEVLAESCRWANLFLASAVDGRPLHVAVLLDNTPDYLFAFGGAALAGATVVGLNHTRVGEHLLRDATHTDCVLLVTEPGHLDAVAAIAAGLPELDGEPFTSERVLVSRRYGPGRLGEGPPLGDPTPAIGRDLDDALAAVSGDDPGLEPDPMTRWALIFTSGTSSAPKAVICTQRRLLTTGNRMGMVLGVESDDVGYICMPLFHSNAVMVGWAPSIVAGASVGLARRFSASGWLDDVRHYGATWFNYTGKPLAYVLATPERPDDADNPVRVAFGNEGAPEVVAEFARRFGVSVIDAFGATEGGVAVARDGGGRQGAMGRAGEDIRVVDADGEALPLARFDDDGHLLNPDECIGEIVNTSGAGPFEGYYNNDEATERATKGGWYWSGDLGYLDEDRYLYFAGRTSDWIRVDGENFPAGPIEHAVSLHPDVVVAAVYGVPDAAAGDQVMAALRLRDGAAFDGAEFAAWIDALDDVGPKWRPRYVRVVNEMPTTGTNKIVVRTLAREKFRHDLVAGDGVWVRDRGSAVYRPFTRQDEATLHAAFTAAGRIRFWDL